MSNAAWRKCFFVLTLGMALLASAVLAVGVVQNHLIDFAMMPAVIVITCVIVGMVKRRAPFSSDDLDLPTLVMFLFFSVALSLFSYSMVFLDTDYSRLSQYVIAIFIGAIVLSLQGTSRKGKAGPMGN